MSAVHDLSSYQELAAEIRQRGWFEKATGRILFELVLHLSLHFGGIVVFLLTDSVWLKVVAILISAYGGLGVATNTHTSSHHATSRHQWLDRGLTYFGYTFLFGTSAKYWWNKHCVIHHPSPNVVGVDDDVDLMPFFAINQREYDESRGLRRFFYKYVQWILIPFVLALNTFFTQLQGWVFLVPILFDSQRRRPGHWLDLAVLGMHWAAWVFIPMMFFAPVDVLLFCFLRNALMGYGMFFAFAPAHFPEEAPLVDNIPENDYVLKQTATTINFRTGFLGRLVCSGVDFQIEHHLFPNVPHIYYPELSKMMQEYCQRQGYPYRSLPWGEAIWKSLLIFYRPKEVLTFEEAAKVEV